MKRIGVLGVSCILLLAPGGDAASQVAGSTTLGVSVEEVKAVAIACCDGDRDPRGCALLSARSGLGPNRKRARRTPSVADLTGPHARSTIGLVLPVWAGTIRRARPVQERRARRALLTLCLLLPS